MMYTHTYVSVWPRLLDKLGQTGCGHLTVLPLRTPGGQVDGTILQTLKLVATGSYYYLESFVHNPITI